MLRYLLAFLSGAFVAVGVLALLTWIEDERSYKADMSRRVWAY